MPVDLITVDIGCSSSRETSKQKDMKNVKVCTNEDVKIEC